MKRISYFAMTALLTAGLSLTGFAQASGSSGTMSKTQAKTASSSADPCQAQKDAVTKASAGKDKKATSDAKAKLKACQDNQKKAKKKGGN